MSYNCCEEWIQVGLSYKGSEIPAINRNIGHNNIATVLSAVAYRICFSFWKVSGSTACRELFQLPEVSTGNV